MKHKRLAITLIAISSFLLICFIACAIYLGTYYRADDVFLDSLDYTQLNKYELDGATAFYPDEAEIGIIFYPGARVEPSAYEPLMWHLASDGFLAILVEMPLNIALLEPYAGN